MIACDVSPKVQLAYQGLLRLVQGKPPGMPLPPVSALMRELRTSQLTVQRAYDVLERQGLIDRQPGRGVFVADRILTGEVAIVLKPSQLAMGASPYYAAASQEMIRQIQALSPKLRGKIHTGGPQLDPHEHALTLDLLDPTVRDGLRGVVAFQPLFEVETALQQAGIPVVSLAPWAPGQAVLADRQAGMEMAVHELRQRGARRIGWITMPGPERDHEHIQFTPTDLGFKVRPPWQMLDARGGEFAGYESMRAIWARDDKPDALIVTDDILCNGVLRALLHLNVEPPEGVRLITFTNKDVPLHYHKPVTRIEFDWQRQCRLTAELLLKLASDPDAARDEPVLVRPVLISGETS